MISPAAKSVSRLTETGAPLTEQLVGTAVDVDPGTHASFGSEELAVSTVVWSGAVVEVSTGLSAEPSGLVSSAGVVTSSLAAGGSTDSLGSEELGVSTVVWSGAVVEVSGVVTSSALAAIGAATMRPATANAAANPISFFFNTRFPFIGV